jgi:hypothetical protein
MNTNDPAHGPQPANRHNERPSISGRDLLGPRNLVILILALGVLPLLWPTIPPLVDLPNHMSRYRIGLDYGTSPFFRQWFDFHWVLVGNLGVDLLVTALAPLLGLEPATKLVIMAVPALTIGGILLIAREVHGRVPPTTALAAMLTYNFAFNFGFVNYVLAVGLALMSFALWLRLGRIGAIRLRAALFVPIGFLVWLCHACGWGILGILIFTWEAASARADRASWPKTLTRSVVACLPLTFPLVPMLFWSAAVPRGSLGTFNYDPGRKLALIFLSLRNGTPIIDTGSMIVLWAIGILGVIRHDLEFDRRLTIVAAALLLTYLLMPTDLMGSGHADLRIAPYVVMLFLVALRPTASTRFTRALGVFAIVFFTFGIVYHTVVYARINRAQEHVLKALDHLPLGARVFGFARVSCSATMEGNRMEHIHRIAIVRRQAFTNGTWPFPASQTLIVHPDMVSGYSDESSQLLEPSDCRDDMTHTIQGRLATLPPGRYDYFWLLDVPPEQWPDRNWLRIVWHNDRTVLYRILPHVQPMVGTLPARKAGT